MAAQMPTIHFFNLERGESDLGRMDEFANRAFQEFLDEQGPAWNQLSIDDQWDKEFDVKLRAVSIYRASLVGLAPLEAESGTGSGGPCASWQLNDLAKVCTESYQSVKWFINNCSKNHTELLSQASGTTLGYERIACVVQPQNLVCLKLPRPEDSRPDGFPVFAYTGFLPGADLDIFHQSGQAVNVPWNNNVTITDVEPFWEYPNVPTDCYPTLHRCCPELACLDRIAFIFEPREAFESIVASMPRLRHRPVNHIVGLNALWPYNLPALKEIFLIDWSISPKAGVQRALGRTPSFSGSGVAFYEVGPQDTDVWDITTAEGNLIPVFQDAGSLQNHYSRNGTVVPSHITVKLLACVPA
jgi:hypothetical protein